MEIKKNINYCHFSLDKFYRHTRGFNESLLAEYLNLYVEYMETGKCSSITLAMQEYFTSRNIEEDFIFLRERALGAIQKARNAAKERWSGKEEQEDTQAMPEQCLSIKQAYANINRNINNNKKENINKKEIRKEKKENFKKPTIEELKDYIQEKAYTFSAEAFYDHYESKGWLIGKTPMKCWKSACNTWQRGQNNIRGDKNGKYQGNNKDFTGEDGEYAYLYK